MGTPLVTSKPIPYVCAGCQLTFQKEELVAKRVQYREMGSDGKVIMTRVISWLCRVPPSGGQSCLDLDPDFHRPKYENAPGTLAKRDAPAEIIEPEE